MISVNCTQCRARLEMDDAFAGGVCRCQYCGTIQTVPSLSKIKRQMSPTESAPAAGTAPPGVAAPASPRPRGGNSPAAEPSGLDALAEAVASSSGLGRGSLRAAPPPPPPGTPADPAVPPDAPPAATANAIEYARPAQQKGRPPWLIVTGAAIAALFLVALGGALFSVRSVSTTATTVTPPVPPGPGPANNGSRGEPNNDGIDTSDGDAPVIPATPHFCGISLQGEPSVVYVLDRGSATAEMFDTLKEATYRSLESLKPDQKFAIMFWNNGGEDACYPEDGLANVRPPEIAAARAKFADVYAGGRADPHDAIKSAAALRPSAIVLVTGKAFALEEDVMDLTREFLGGSRTKVHTVALGSDDDTTVLKRIAQSTGGQSRVVTKRELRAFSE